MGGHGCGVGLKVRGMGEGLVEKERNKGKEMKGRASIVLDCALFLYVSLIQSRVCCVGINA